MRGLRIYFILWFSLATSMSFAAPTFPELTGRVVDQVGLLSADKKLHIITNIKIFDERRSEQIAVAIVTSLEGYDIRDYGVQLGRYWGLGQKDENNGVLLLVAPNERKVSIEVGYGLEARLPDALAFAIIQDVILPKFKAGKMGQGVQLGVDSIISSLVGKLDLGELEAQKQRREELDDLYIDFFKFIFLALMVGGIIYLMILDRLAPLSEEALRRSLNLAKSTGRYSGGGRSSGGGGFSGGGGSFGGGGASGSW